MTRLATSLRTSTTTRRDFARATVTALIIIGAMSTMAMADDIRRVAANGTELSYVEVGQGEPIIFVHGALQDYRMWAEHLPKFAGSYRAIAYSRRNHFPNDVSPDGMPDGAADAHGEDLAAFVGALGLSKVRIVAHSSGAHAALFFAAMHSDMIVSLALNEPPATGLLAGVPNAADILKEWGSKQTPAREAFRAGDSKTGIPLFVNAVGGPGAYEGRSDAHKKMNLDNGASSQADATTKRPRPVFTCEMAKAISAPALLSNGERSPKFFYLIMDQLESCLPNRERIVVAGSSHTVPSENPEAYDRDVLAFLGKQ
jgi:non-heme chloroperoxidase